MPGFQWQILRKLQLELETSTVQSEGGCGFRVYDGYIIGRRLALSLRDLFVGARSVVSCPSLHHGHDIISNRQNTLFGNYFISSMQDDKYAQTADPANRQVVLSSLGCWVLGCGMHLPLLNSRHTCSPLSIGVKV